MPSYSTRRLSEKCRYCVADPDTGKIKKMDFGGFGILEVQQAHLHRLGCRSKPKGRDLVFLQTLQGFFLLSQTWWKGQPYPFFIVAQVLPRDEQDDFFQKFLPHLKTFLREQGLNKIEQPEKVEVYQRGLEALPPSAFEEFKAES